MIGTVAVPRSPDQVRAVLADPAWVATTDGGGTVVTVEERGDPCLVMKVVSPSFLKDVVYRVRRCTTPTGYREDLVESDAFETYSVAWDVEPLGAGSTVRYTLKMRTRWPVPQFVVDDQARKGVTRMLSHIGAALD